MAPTLLDFGHDIGAFHASKAMEDEIFGPVLPMVTFEDLDQVLSSVSAKEKPLALYFFSSDSVAQEKILNETTSGGHSENPSSYSDGSNPNPNPNPNSDVRCCDQRRDGTPRQPRTSLWRCRS